MKKLFCLCLSLLMCLSLVTPIASAEEKDAWDCINFTVDTDEDRLYKDSVTLVEVDAWLDAYFGDSTLNEIYAFPSNAVFTVENLDCPYGMFVYFQSYKLGNGTVELWDMEDEDYITVDTTGKYYGYDSVQYMATEAPEWTQSTPVGNGYVWLGEFSAYPSAENILLLQAGESVSFTLPNATPDTLFRVYARYYNEAEDYSYWKYIYCVVDDGLYAQSTPVVEEEEDEGNPFTDVPADAYYHDAVLWAYENNITNGISATTFGPKETCTRGQVVTFLWRANGCPEPTSTNNPFTDVSEKDYFYKAVLWAAEQGITNGITATTFGAKDTCSSGHIVTFLWRANGKPTATGDSVLAAANPGQWYTEAVAWADTAGLLSGSDIAFEPKNNSPRADVVTYLYLNQAD